ncbi:leucine-rich repeat domain-containing protein [Pigmentibacter ruber]|uniref:leucine-rich repeat domain-containing protein n=1 Tax=Pigmentibacter ruber TaxID=2683196 RepID=UPI00131A8953|nr:leucine-rich repeat domain-containing protein [Pigmentibacter ruber]
MLKKLLNINLLIPFLYSISVYANNQNDFEMYIEPKPTKQPISKKSFADDNEIIYIIENKNGNGNLSAKVAKINGEITTGGIDEETSKLSDYKIQIPRIQNAFPTIVLDATTTQDTKCNEVLFSIKQGYAFISQLPNSIDAATYCSFNVKMGDVLIKKVSFLMNYSYKKWCSLNTGLEATKTARKIDSDCNTSNVKLIRLLNLDGENLDSKIKDISPITSLKSIQGLFLGDNLINNIPVNAFLQLKQLEWLDLYSNNLENLDNSIFSTNKILRGISLADNKLNKLPTNIFSNLQELQELILDRNELENLGEDIFKNNSKLKELYISGNKLYFLPKNTFKNLRDLEKLYLSQNKFTLLDADIFSNNINLKELSLEGNQISELPKEIFSTLINLNYLSLLSNKIESLDNELFIYNSNIKKLSLDMNKIKLLPKTIFSNLTNLERLSMYDNKLEHLDPEVFQNNTKLKKLTLNENKLQILPQNVFKSLVNLEELDLRSNFISNLEEIFRNDERLRNITQVR